MPSSQKNAATCNLPNSHGHLGHQTKITCQRSESNHWPSRDETNLSENLIRAKIADVDTRDGQAHEKIAPSDFPCPKCGSNCNSCRLLCIMCGEDPIGHKDHIFEA